VAGVRPAQIDIRVPETAEVWIDDVRLNQHGRRRRFISMPMEPDRTFTYEVTARWRQNDSWSLAASASC
jgi:uncharacterized protein (TIGR03000 family)